MKNLQEIDPVSIPGAVIDPKTGRLCATGSDIGRALGLANRQIEHCRQEYGTRRYQDKYHDIADILAARARVAKVGRPRLTTETEVA